MPTDVLDSNDGLELCGSVAAHFLHTAAQAQAYLLMYKTAIMQWSPAAAAAHVLHATAQGSCRDLSKGTRGSVRQ